MTQQEILDYNKRCSEFLGYKKDTVNGRDVVRIPNKTWSEWSHRLQDYIEDDWYALYEPSFHSLQFHLDWNWTMEVVEAIEKLGYWVCIQNTYIGFGNKNDENTFLNYSFSSFKTTKKEAVLQAINQFLIWYNKQAK